ncbi:MAG: hypothetical protein QOK35_102 [Pseudonocardiales bacterium]|nr:hypothetical protein [Pseudonocardiales bacterium]
MSIDTAPEDVGPATEARIARILDDRRRLLPGIRAETARWQTVDEQLAALATAVEALRTHATTPADLRDALALPFAEAREGAAEAVRLLRVLEARFARETVNIGVSGQARVGKSTLLQSVSGLGDDQVPTGQALPVTAVRSRIFHSPDLRRATLRLHTFDTFVTEVVAPYHAELDIAGLPGTVEEFRGWAYPKPGDAPADLSQPPGSAAPLAGDGRAEGLRLTAAPSWVTMLNRLRAMQASLPTYAHDLTGGERVVPLEELRAWVAYPTNAQEQEAQQRRAGPVQRRYLAVRDVRIDCPFPHAQVRRLGIVDLPGLGEFAARADQHHVSGLQNEVDVVLLVKRPVEGMAFWGDADARALDLIDSARGFADRRDFVFLVINTGDTAEALLTALRDHIRGQVNSGVPDQFFRVLECDAADTTDVFAHALSPVLDHLAARMPTMDADTLAGTRGELHATAQRIGVLTDDLGRALGSVARASGSVAEDLDLRARRLRQDLSGALVGLVSQLRAQARAIGEDQDYTDAVEKAYTATRTWITDGLGVGEQVWRDEALRNMTVDRNSSRYAGDELNRVRVEISSCFEEIDIYFAARVRALWDSVADILRAHTGTVLDPGSGGAKSGEETLRRFAALLAEASEPCPRLRRAVEQLLTVRLDYRSQLHPRVRAELDGLTLQERDPVTGEQRNRVVVEVSADGAEQLYTFVAAMAEQAAYLTKKALLLREGVTPALVLHAAAEQLEDTMIRSGDSEREFKRLARSYRDEIWPGVFGELDAANARVATVARARDALVAKLAEEIS